LEKRGKEKATGQFEDDYKFIQQWPFNSKYKMSCALLEKEGQ